MGVKHVETTRWNTWNNHPFPPSAVQCRSPSPNITKIPRHSTDRALSCLLCWMTERSCDIASFSWSNIWPAGNQTWDIRAMELEMGSHPILIIHFLVDYQFCHVNVITRGLLHVVTVRWFQAHFWMVPHYAPPMNIRVKSSKVATCRYQTSSVSTSHCFKYQERHNYIRMTHIFFEKTSLRTKRLQYIRKQNHGFHGSLLAWNFRSPKRKITEFLKQLLTRKARPQHRGQNCLAS